MNPAHLSIEPRAAVLFWVLVGLTGAALGSFINVVIYRLPRGLSLVRRRSHCPICEHAIAWYDNVPLASYLWLRGRCRHCRAPIPARYPLVEALGAALTVSAFALAPTPIAAALWSAFALALLAVLFIDFDHRIIPDSITLPGTVLGLLAAWWWGPRSLPDALWGVAAGAGGLLLVGLLYRAGTGREGLGLGDVKLMAMVGAFCGWHGALATLVLGSLAGSLAGVGLMLAGRGDGRTALPFGSFLAPAGWVVLFAGEWLWASYLRLLGG